MELALDTIFAIRCHPADIEAVDADTVAQHRISDIAGQCIKRPFGSAVSRNEGLTSHGRHGGYIDNRAFYLVAAEELDCVLNEEERRTRVDGKKPIKQFRRGVEYITAIC
ncbi:hypothetical protein D9M69_567150 [compost metagenome]